MEDVLFEAVASITSLLPQVQSAVLFGASQTRLVLSDKAELFEDKRIDSRWLEGLREPVVLAEPLLDSEPSVLLLPLVYREIPLAVLYLGSSQPQAFSASHRVVASLLVPTLVLILGEQWARYSDSLTGLYSHGLFQQKLADELEWCHTHQRESWLALFEIDHFRRFNDALGHERGDETLLELAALLRGQTAQSDVVARWKGDCFGVCFREQQFDTARETCETIRDLAAKVFRGRLLSLSIGLGDCRSFDSRRTWVAAVEEALSRSKQAGGNRVTVAEGEGGAGQPSRLPGGPKGPRSASESKQIDG